MAVNVDKLQEMFPLVDINTINEIVAKNPGQKMYTEAIPQLKLIQEYKESVNPQPSAPSAPSAPSVPSVPYEIPRKMSQNEGVAPVTLDPPKPYQDNNNMKDVLLQTKEEYLSRPTANRYDSINMPYSDAQALNYELYKNSGACCPCCCSDPRKPRQAQWSCDCRECCKCCFLLPNDDNYNGTKSKGGFLYEKDVKLFMYAFLLLIILSMPAEIAYDIDVDDGKRENLFIGPIAMIVALIGVILYFTKCVAGPIKNRCIAITFFIAAILYFGSYVYHTVYLKDFTPDCSDWIYDHSCNWWYGNDYCYECVCGYGPCDTCVSDSFSETYEDCYHFEKSYFVSRGIYIGIIMGLLSLHFAGIKRVITSRMGWLKFLMIILTFYSICVGGVTAGSYYYQVISGCASFSVALLLFIMYFLIDKMNKSLKYKGGCNGVITMGSLMYVFVAWNTLAQLVTTAIVVANWGDDKGGWLWCWEFSITIFGLFNFIIFWRALHPCLMCTTCSC